MIFMDLAVSEHSLYHKHGLMLMGNMINPRILGLFWDCLVHHPFPFAVKSWGFPSILKYWTLHPFLGQTCPYAHSPQQNISKPMSSLKHILIFPSENDSYSKTMSRCTPSHPMVTHGDSRSAPPRTPADSYMPRQGLRCPSSVVSPIRKLTLDQCLLETQICTYIICMVYIGIIYIIYI